MARSPSFTVGIIQEAVTDDVDKNVATAETYIREAADKGAQIVCLQELFNAPYFCKSQKHERFDLAEPIPGPTIERMQKMARELEMVLVVPIFERQAAGVYRNSAAVIDADGTLLGAYRKMHIPDDPLFNEKFYFTPGDSHLADDGDHKGASGFRVWKTRFANIGVLICWDQWYPEAARITSLLGAEILFYPTAIGWATSQDEATNKEQYNAWQTIQCSHAVANGVHVVSVNRVGFEQNGKMKFWGGSFVSNPFGTILTQASHEKEEVIVQEIDTDKTDSYRTHWPFLRDRRIDSYQPITERFIDTPNP